MDRSFAVVLPLKKKARLEIGEVITELRLLVEQTGATVRIDPRMANGGQGGGGGLFSLRGSQPELMQFELDGVRMRIAQQAHPFADRNNMGRYVNPVMWEAGLGEFIDHRTHIRVYEAGIEGEEGPDATFDRAAAVTAAASVVARLTEPVGAIWETARNSIPAPRLGAALEELMEGAAPLGFWLRWHVIPPGEMEDHAPGLVTSGLMPFAGHEILARPSAVDTRVMIEHAFELARRLVDEKMTVSDNQVVEGQGGTPLRLRLGARFHEGGQPVCEIALSPEALARAAEQRGGRQGPRIADPSDPLFGMPVSLAGAGEGPVHALTPPRIEPGPLAPMAGPAEPAGEPAAPDRAAASARPGRRRIRVLPGPRSGG